MTPNPTARPFIRQRSTGPFWYGKWSRNGQPVIRALGRAWAEPDGAGGWKRRRGRPPKGTLTEAEAAAQMLALVREHGAEQTLLERDAEERRRRGVTFRELAGDYLAWLADVKGAKPSTLRDHRLLLAEPGTANRRGVGTSRGLIMAALGDRLAREVTTREVEDLLRSIASTGVAPRTVDKTRQLVCAIFNYGARPSTYGLAVNSATHADRRPEPERGPLPFYSPEQIEALARALADGAHRDPSRPALDEGGIAARAREDVQDAQPARVAAYAGLRRGGLVALHWRASTSPAGRSWSAAHCRGIPSSARRRAADFARFPFQIKPQRRSSASAAGAGSSARTTTYSPTASAAASTRRRFAVVSSALATPPASSRCDSTISAIPSAPCSSPAGSTWQA